MQSALTNISENDILGQLLARRDGDEIPAVELTRTGKEMAVALGNEVDATLVPGVTVEFAGHESHALDKWIGALDPGAGLIVIGAEKDNDANVDAVMASVDFVTVVTLASGALGGDPSAGAAVAGRAMTGFEKDFLPLLGKAVAAPLAEMLPSHLTRVTGMPVSVFEPTTVTGSKMIVFRYTIAFGDAGGGMAVAIPEAYLKLHRAKHKAQAGRAEGDDPLASNVCSSRLRVQASISLPSATLGSLRNLKVGDLVPIPVENFDKGMLTTRGRQVFAVQIGQVNDAFSFRVLHPVRKGGGLLDRVAESLARAG